jgi:hypothetical protein
MEQDVLHPFRAVPTPHSSPRPPSPMSSCRHCTPIPALLPRRPPELSFSLVCDSPLYLRRCRRVEAVRAGRCLALTSVSVRAWMQTRRKEEADESELRRMEGYHGSFRWCERRDRARRRKTLFVRPPHRFISSRSLTDTVHFGLVHFLLPSYVLSKPKENGNATTDFSSRKKSSTHNPSRLPKPQTLRHPSTPFPQSA